MKNLLLFACGLLSAGAASADAAFADNAILKCRAQPDTARRLACYDAIPVGAAPAAAAAPMAAPAPSVAPAVAAATAAPAAPAAAAVSPEQGFGLRPAVKKQQNVEPASIRSSVAGRFDGWAPGSIITLANGQVWKVTDDTDAVLPIMQNPNVEITRGLIGAYFLQVEGHVNTARVVRIK